MLFSAVTVASIAVTETDATSQGTLTAVLNAASTTKTVVSYTTANGTAKAGSDYTKTTGTVTIPPGQTTASFTIPILGGTTYEPTEAFKVALKISKGDALTTKSATVTIDDNDPQPTASLADETVAVGTKGSKTVSIPVTLSNPSSLATRLYYTTDSVTAEAGKDYVSKSGWLTIPTGALGGTIKLTVKADSAVDADRAFNVNLTKTENATLAPSTVGATEYARVVIQTQGTSFVRPTLTVSNATITAGVGATFTVTLSSPATEDVSVAYRTQNGTALAGTNYTAAAGLLTITAGQTAQTITVAINPSAPSSSKTFYILFDAPANAVLATPTATGIIAAASPSSTSTTSTTTTPTGPTVDLSDNLSSDSDSTETATGSTYLTASFETGATDATLTSVQLLLSRVSSTGAASVRIYSDDGFEPASLLGTLTSPADYSSALTATAFTTNGIALTANMKYWVVLVAGSGSFNWAWTDTSTGSGSGFTGEWGESPDAGVNWYTDVGLPLQMSVYTQ